MIKRVWQVDPLLSPRRGGARNIVRSIAPTQPDVRDVILTHGGLADEPSRAPPQDTSAGELQYVSDLEFVQEPGPAEPVWSPD